MFFCLVLSQKLHWNFIIFLSLITLSNVRGSDTLNFDEESSTRPISGRNDEEKDEKMYDGHFGERIILGIIENSDEPITQIPDQKRSQTIVKFFDKEDYDGIKTNPIVVEDPYEDDATQNEKTRNRKEILKQDQTGVLNNEETFQENEDHTDVYEDKEKIIGHRSEKSNEKYEDEKTPETNEKENKEISSTYVKENDDTIIQQYKEHIPANHKETYTDVIHPDEYTQSHQEIRRTEPPTNDLKESSEYNNKESAESSDEKANVFRKDQKGIADQSHENVKKNRTGKHASGDGQEQHEEHHKRKGDKGMKNFKGYHEELKKKKGHHDEENHEKKYADKGGEEKKHHEVHGDHGDHHKGEKGEKESEFSEEGKHNKGHSTKGEHNIHKKDEYDKKQEFYDEHHEGGEHEEHGGFHHEKHYKKGGHKKSGHHKKGDLEDHYGKKSYHEKGHYYDDKGAKKKASGHNNHHSHNSKHGKKVGTSGEKNWRYKKGTGRNGHKKRKEEQYVAPSNLQQIKKAPVNILDKNNEENNFPRYIAKLHDHNDNRRRDQIDYTDKRNINNETVDEKKGEVSKIVDSELNREKYEDAQIDSKEIDDQHSGELSSNLNVGIKQNGIENIESDLPSESSIQEHNDNSKKISSKLLPKIYVILPKDFEDQLHRSAENSESYFNEDLGSFYKDSAEKANSPKIQTNRRIYTKTVEAPSFPEEHKKRLSEIGYIIHKIGSKKGENMEDINYQSKMRNKPLEDDNQS